MPIEHKRVGNACERCKKLDTEVGKITHYTKDGADLLLCPKCLEQREKHYTEKCPKCKKIAYEHGGLTFYDDSDVDDSNSDINDDFESFVYDEKPPSSELMCMECYDKKVVKERKARKIKLIIKNFAKNNWKTWISITFAIIGLVIAISRL